MNETEARVDHPEAVVSRVQLPVVADLLVAGSEPAGGRSLGPNGNDPGCQLDSADTGAVGGGGAGRLNLDRAWRHARLSVGLGCRRFGLAVVAGLALIGELCFRITHCCRG